MRRSSALVLLVVLALSACGGGDDEKKESSGTTTTGQTAVTGQKADTEFCKKAKELAAAAAAQAADTSPEGLRKAYEAAATTTGELARLAPEELAADLKMVNDATQQLVVALREAGYDFSKLSAEANATLNDPKIQEASTRVGDYLKGPCGIDPNAGAPVTTLAPGTSNP